MNKSFIFEVVRGGEDFQPNLAGLVDVCAATNNLENEALVHCLPIHTTH